MQQCYKKIVICVVKKKIVTCLMGHLHQVFFSISHLHQVLPGMSMSFLSGTDVARYCATISSIQPGMSIHAL
jgi:hypothetical protein